MRARPESPCYPPRASTSVPFTEDALTPFVDNNWIAQCKFNDSHCLIKINSSNIEIWNRHNAKFTDYKPSSELYEELKSLIRILDLNPDNYHIVDGGILDKKHTAIKQTIVIWDIFAIDNKYLIGSSYIDRFSSIKNDGEQWCFPNSDVPVARKLTENIIVPINWDHKDWSTLWQVAVDVNKHYDQPLAEGLMLKNPNGILNPCFSDNNNGDWMCRCRVNTRRHCF